MTRQQVIDDYVRYSVDLNTADEPRPLTEKFAAEFINTLEKKHDWEVTLEQLAQILGTREDNLKKTLKRRFAEGVDYRIQKRPSTGAGHRSKEDVLLSKKCLKAMSMKSGAPNSDQARTYFDNQEEVGRETAMQEREYALRFERPEVTQAKRTRQSRPRQGLPSGNSVYVISVDSGGDMPLSKLGRSRVLDQRNARHFWHLPGYVDLEHHRQFSDHEWLEKCAHGIIREHEVDNEIFAVDAARAVKALDVCSKYYLPMRREMGLDGYATPQFTDLGPKAKKRSSRKSTATSTKR